MSDNKSFRHLQQLEPPLRIAVSQLRSAAPPAEAVQRVARRAQGIAQTQVHRRRWWRLTRRSAVLGGLAASVLLVLALSTLLTPRHSWAGVTESLLTQPWIRMAWTDEAGVPSVTWISLPRGVSAREIGPLRYFDDHRLNIRYAYDPEADDGEAAIVRRRMPFSNDMERFETQFLRLLKGREPSGAPLGGSQLVSQTQRHIEEGGRSFVEHELVLQRNSHDSAYGWIFRVDPVTNLPSQIRVVERRDGEPRVVTMQVDYPSASAGPRDIYSLGVDRETRLVDLVPDERVSEILAALEAGSDRFGDFRAIVKEIAAGESLSESAPMFRIVSRKGDKWRVDSANLKEMPPAGEAHSDQQYTVEWWFDQLQYYEIRPSMLSDGTAIYRNESTGDEPPLWTLVQRLNSEDPDFLSVAMATQVRPDYYGYRYAFALAQRGGLVASDADEISMPGAIQLAAEGLKFWVDPMRSYVTWKAQLDEGGRTYTVTNEKFAQAPSGVWYPTVSRAFVEGENGEKNDGGIRRWFFVDFDAELPDALFTR